MNAELIIHTQDQYGRFDCEQFSNLPAPKSVYVAICYTDNQTSRDSAYELKQNLVNSLINSYSNFKQTQPPCYGMSAAFKSCGALSKSDVVKLLIVVTDGGSNVFADPDVLTWTDRILPIAPRGANITLPAPISNMNAVFWDRKIEETVTYIFGMIGVSDEDQRIFISYRRVDTAKLAEQLFDRLTKRHFEVFLDTYSINPGIHFQNRLYQELADKAMVVFLESKNFSNSEWTQAEAAFVKLNKLGYIALNINNAPKIPSVDEQYRIMIDSKDLEAGEKLTDDKLDEVVEEIKKRHSAALNYMKDYLNISVISALNTKGIVPQYDGRGFICDDKDKFKVWTTPRPPKIDDYHHAEDGGSPSKKYILGPRFMEDKRRMLNAWLAGKSGIGFYSEGEILDLVDSI